MKKITKYQREPPTTIQDAIKRYYFNSTHFNSTNHTGGNNTFNMEEQNTGAYKTTPNYFIRTTNKQEELLFSLYRIIRRQAEPPTTNRIKRAQTANKTLLLQLYTLQ